MVHGLTLFRDFFQNNAHQYVLIGGSACSILIDSYGLQFRRTKDLDIVVIIEQIDDSFVENLKKFIAAGGYEHLESGHKKEQFYRFSDPKNPEFPIMLELFCRNPDGWNILVDKRIVRLQHDDVSVSLSAILLDDDYYYLIVKNSIIIDGLSILSLESLVCLKIKAWLNLQKDKQTGIEISSKIINKHRNDIFRLAQHMTASNQLKVKDSIKEDVITFINLIIQDPPHLKSLGIKETTLDVFLDIFKQVFL